MDTRKREQTASQHPDHHRAAVRGGSSPAGRSARSTSQTCGMEASSARGSTRTPNTDPPSGDADHLVGLPQRAHQQQRRGEPAGPPRGAAIPGRPAASAARPPSTARRGRLADPGHRTPSPLMPWREVLGDRRDHVLAVRGERRVLAVVLQVDRELVDAEVAQLAQPRHVLLDRAEHAEPVDDLVRHEVGVRVAGPAVLVVVVALPAGDVVGQRLRHAGVACRSGRRCRRRGCRPCRRTSGTGPAGAPGRPRRTRARPRRS